MITKGSAWNGSWNFILYWISREKKSNNQEYMAAVNCVAIAVAIPIVACFHRFICINSLYLKIKGEQFSHEPQSKRVSRRLSKTKPHTNRQCMILVDIAFQEKYSTNFWNVRKWTKFADLNFGSFSNDIKKVIRECPSRSIFIPSALSRFNVYASFASILCIWRLNKSNFRLNSQSQS